MRRGAAATEAPRLEPEVRGGGAFSARGFAPLWFSGLCWHWGRWAIAFLASYHVNQITGSPRMVQLTGAIMWAPLLLGGAIGGVISDRFDRRRTVRLQTALLVPFVAVVGLAERAGQLGIALLYPFLLFAGIGWVVDMTSRRALVLDIVGPHRLHKAMAWETMALASGVAAGQLLGGAVADRAGVGAAFLGVAAMLGLGLVLLMWVPHVPPARPAASAADRWSDALRDRIFEVVPLGRAGEAHGHSRARTSTLTELRAGLRLARTNRSLLSILGVTVMANFFMFAYFPAVQLIGDQVNATASQIGIIGSMTGFGMITGSLVTARWGDGRWGIAYSFGVFVAMAMLIVWALSPNVLIAVITLYVASCGSGLFAATQSTLVLTAVSEEMRGRAMGLLSMAIGALPVGTYVLGEVAQQLGARTAVILMASLGLAGMTLWLLIRPEVLQRSGPTP
ncbi:MAG: MFS transporter [Acidimicrobiales bacterium]|nr:MFS transporter [Acidimicrobiales bacterium]MYA82432.1 MFS transporter [Acidimicrobiales bacterium]MYB82116.1 MFS transporter [Acidimicrobiales bacterium]MYH73690.1 MFS transporter [Acidimicrobiales bacterium]MYI13921.1 MFS transporter [Acidimicrobiales bacterium]